MDLKKINDANISFDADISPITDGKNSPFLKESGFQGEDMVVADFTDFNTKNGFNRILRKKLSTDLEIKATMDEIKEIENKSAVFNYNDKDIIFFEDNSPKHQPTFRKRNFSNVDDIDELREETNYSKSTKVIKFIDNPLISFDDPNLFKNVIQPTPLMNSIHVLNHRSNTFKVGLPGQVISSTTMEEIKEISFSNKEGSESVESNKNKESISPDFRKRKNSHSSQDEPKVPMARLRKIHSNSKKKSPLIKNLSAMRFGTIDNELCLFPAKRHNQLFENNPITAARKDSNDSSSLSGVLSLSQKHSSNDLELNLRKEVSAESDLKFLQQRKDGSFDSELFILAHRKDLSIDSELFSLKRPALISRDNDSQERKING